MHTHKLSWPSLIHTAGRLELSSEAVLCTPWAACGWPPRQFDAHYGPIVVGFRRSLSITKIVLTESSSSSPSPISHLPYSHISEFVSYLLPPSSYLPPPISHPSPHPQPTSNLPSLTAHLPQAATRGAQAAARQPQAATARPQAGKLYTATLEKEFSGGGSAAIALRCQMRATRRDPHNTALARAHGRRRARAARKRRRFCPRSARVKIARRRGRQSRRRR